MNKRFVLCGVACALMLTGGLFAQEKTKPTVFSFLTEEQKKEFGLSKLDAQECQRFDTWTTLLLTTTIKQQTLEPETLEGAIIIAGDDEMLGRISSNKFDDKSIANQFGKYGSQFEANSIFNRFSPYAGKFSDLSIFNRLATKPPKILLNDHVVGYLTLNKSFTPRANPYAVIGYAKYSE